MIDFRDYYSENEDPTAWKQAKNATGLYILANPFALDSELYTDLAENLTDEADNTYQHPSGWSYKVKYNQNGDLYIIGWKTKQQQQQQGQGGYQQRRSNYPQKTYSKSYGPAAKSATPPISQQQHQKPEVKYVDVEVKYTDNLSTVNEILSNGYMNGEIWRYEGIVALPTLENENDAAMKNIPHFILIRSKQFIAKKPPQPQHRTPDQDYGAPSGAVPRNDGQQQQQEEQVQYDY